MSKSFPHFSSAKVLFNLQALRAFAALNVVLFHILGTANSYGFPTHHLHFLVGWGANGVDLFFVLSGFVMVYLLHKQSAKPISAGHFLLDRFTRIAPLYYFLSVVLFCSVLAFPSVFRSIANISSIDLIASLLFLSQALGFGGPLLFDGWTLEYEMLFYFILACSLVLPFPRARIILTPLVLLLLIIFAGLGTISLEFVFGMGIAYLFFFFKERPPFALVIFLVGIVWFCASLWLTPSTPLLNHRVIQFGLPSALIVYGLLGLSQMQPNSLTHLGDASYSIYLIQVFTIPAFYKLCSSKVMTSLIALIPNPALSFDLLILLCLGFTALCGLLLHHTIERPLIQLARRCYD